MIIWGVQKYDGTQYDGSPDLACGVCGKVAAPAGKDQQRR